MTKHIKVEGSDRVSAGKREKLPTKKLRRTFPKSERLTEVVAVNLTDSQRKMLDSLAHHYDMPAAAVMRVALIFAFQHHDVVFNPEKL